MGFIPPGPAGGQPAAAPHKLLTKRLNCCALRRSKVLLAHARATRITAQCIWNTCLTAASHITQDSVPSRQRRLTAVSLGLLWHWGVRCATPRGARPGVPCHLHLHLPLR